MSTNKLQTALIKKMVTQYRNVQLVSIENAAVNPVPRDSNSLWLSLAAIKDFIAEMELAMAKYPENPITNPGLRFYYSAYPDSELWDAFEDLNTSSTPQEYAGKHTLIAVPTLEKARVNCDFDPLDLATYDGSGIPPNAKYILAMNHGTLYPPGNAVESF